MKTLTFILALVALAGSVRGQNSHIVNASVSFRDTSSFVLTRTDTAVNPAYAYWKIQGGTLDSAFGYQSIGTGLVVTTTNTISNLSPCTNYTLKAYLVEFISGPVDSTAVLDSTMCVQPGSATADSLTIQTLSSSIVTLGLYSNSHGGGPMFKTLYKSSDQLTWVLDTNTVDSSMAGVTVFTDYGLANDTTYYMFTVFNLDLVIDTSPIVRVVFPSLPQIFLIDVLYSYGVTDSGAYVHAEFDLGQSGGIFELYSDTNSSAGANPDYLLPLGSGMHVIDKWIGNYNPQTLVYMKARLVSLDTTYEDIKTLQFTTLTAPTSCSVITDQMYVNATRDTVFFVYRYWYNGTGTVMIWHELDTVGSANPLASSNIEFLPPGNGISVTGFIAVANAGLLQNNVPYRGWTSMFSFECDTNGNVIASNILGPVYVTDIKQVQSELEMFMPYPNPTSGTVSGLPWNRSGDGGGTAEIVSVTNALGQRMHVECINGACDLSLVGSGIHILSGMYKGMPWQRKVLVCYKK